jgi:lipid A 3-O-deacylase
MTSFAAARNVDTGEIVPFVGDAGLLRVGYANDYFSGTDRYYTQGLAVDVFHPVLRKSPLMRLLPALPDSSRSYGLSLRDTTFTPSHIDSDGPLIGDRPFADYAFLGHVLVSKDPARGLTLVAEFDAGLIGPGAGGAAQKWAHQVLGDPPPKGWDNQIRDDVVLDYYLRLEKIVQSSPWEDLAFGVDTTAGTLYDNAGAEGTIRFGRVSSAVKNHYYVFGRGMEKAVGYDATLQGGVTNRHSPYTLSAEQIERFVSRADLGIAVDFDRLALEAVWSDLSPEFRNSLTQRWVEISIIARF